MTSSTLLFHPAGVVLQRRDVRRSAGVAHHVSLCSGSTYQRHDGTRRRETLGGVRVGPRALTSRADHIMCVCACSARGAVGRISLFGLVRAVACRQHGTWRGRRRVRLQPHADVWRCSRGYGALCPRREAPHANRPPRARRAGWPQHGPQALTSLGGRARPRRLVSIRDDWPIRQQCTKMFDLSL